MIYIKDPALFPLIIACAVLFLLFAGTLLAFWYSTKESERKITAMLDEVHELDAEFRTVSSLRGSCQVTYHKPGEKIKNYAFDFKDLEELRAKLSVYPGADQVALYIKNIKPLL